MDKRRARLARLRTVCEEMKKIAEIRLARSKAERAAIAAASEETAASLNAGTPLHGLFTEQMTRRLSRLAAQGQSADAAIARGEKQLQRDNLRLKGGEKLVAAAEAAARKHDAAAALAELIDRIGGRKR